MSGGADVGPPSSPIRAVVLGGLLALAAIFTILLLDEEPRAIQPASRSLGAALVVPPFARACESGVDVPAGAGRVKLVVSTAGKPGPPLRMRVRKAGRVVTQGRHPGRYVDSPVSVRVAEVPRSVPDAEVCVTSAGLVRVALLGAPLRRQESTTQGWIDDFGAPAGPPARVTFAGKPFRQAPERVHFEWQFADERSGLSLAGAVAERFGLVKASFFGSGALWVALALVLAASLGAIGIVVREVGRQ